MKNVFLDLDETLISSIAKSEINFNGSEFKQKLKECKKKGIKYYDIDGYYMTFERPYLQEFLDFLFKNYNVSIWTAATKDYAIDVIQNSILTKPERKLDYVFYSYHRDVSEGETGNTKNLSMLWNTYKLPMKNISKKCAHCESECKGEIKTVKFDPSGKHETVCYCCLTCFKESEPFEYKKDGFKRKRRTRKKKAN